MPNERNTQLTAQQEKNLAIYNQVREVPQNAQKPITEGRLSGKTDINPMWRIKILTQVYGPCGTGWKIEILRQWLEPGDNDTVAAFVNVNLYVKDPATGQWSDPIPGNGGNIFRRKENSGRNYIDDDCFKKAESDAIGSATKKLGIAADVYWDNDDTKYTDGSSGSGNGAVVKSNTPAASSEKPAGRPRPNQTKPVLAPGSQYWNPSVAQAMATVDSIENIRKRIEAKFTITDADFRELMIASGKNM